MKRLILAFILLTSISLTAPVSAEEAEKNYSPFFVFPDIIIYRPISLAATVAGAGLFVAATPFSALAQISPPHDAFEKTANILIMGPGRYTFARPVGNMSLTDY